MKNVLSKLSTNLSKMWNKILNLEKCLFPEKIRGHNTYLFLSLLEIIGFFIGHLILRIFPYEKTPAIVALLYRAGAEPLRKAKLHELYIEELKSVNRALNYLFAQAGIDVKIKETYTGDISDQVKKASSSIKNRMTNEQARVWEEELNKLIRWREEIIRKLRHL